MKNVTAGDRVILSGPIGNHSVHLLSIREGLGFETRVLSDCAPLNGMIETLLAEVGHDRIHSIRDVTRGGLSAVLHEYSRAIGHAIRIEEASLPIQHETMMATDMLGLNALDLANEGCICIFVPEKDVDAVLRSLRKHPYGTGAVEIGRVLEQSGKAVFMATLAGQEMEIEELEGSVLPRLC